MFGQSFRKTNGYMPLVTISNEIKHLDKNKKWKFPSGVITFWIISVILIGLIYLFNFFELYSFLPFTKINQFPILPMKYDTLKGYLINTPGCRIPDVDPYDSSVKRFIHEPRNINCDQGLPPLFESNLTSLFLKTEYLEQYNVTSFDDLNCCYQEFWRKKPTRGQKDSQVRYSKLCISIHGNTTRINEEFVTVICKNKGKGKVYQDYFAFVPVSKKIERGTSGKAKPNILMIGLDAVSRVNLHRQLPKTYKYLTEKLGAIELLGYNKVADNTFPNLMPVLTGMFESELKKTCWHSSNNRFDKCPFLWKEFSKNNYITAFGEDCSWLGLFNYGKVGFFEQPTDYYYTSFNSEMENKIGVHTKREVNCIQCFGEKDAYKSALEYIQNFVIRMKRELVPYFGFFWGNTLSHDDLNRPALGDDTYYNLFRYLKENGHLDNTIFIFMSDHGIRWGGIRRTYQGRLEERLPFVFVVPPKWLKEDYPSAMINLNKNKLRLTTPFDLHETIKALLNMSNLRNSVKGEKIPRGYSLFDEIPKSRTCDDAEIESHWCTCQLSVNIITDDIKVMAAARFAVHIMNSQLSGYAQCATLILDSVLNARVSYHDAEHFTDNNAVLDYTITVITMPGKGIFEVTVRDKGSKPQTVEERNRNRSDVEHWKNFSVTGTISRLNLYGKQSYCITDFHLKLYCYCKSLL